MCKTFSPMLLTCLKRIWNKRNTLKERVVLPGSWSAVTSPEMHKRSLLTHESGMLASPQICHVSQPKGLCESFMSLFRIEKYIHLALLWLTGASLWHMNSWGINLGTLLTKTKMGHSCFTGLKVTAPGFLKCVLVFEDVHYNINYQSRVGYDWGIELNS